MERPRESAGELLFGFNGEYCRRKMIGFSGLVEVAVVVRLGEGFGDACLEMDSVCSMVLLPGCGRTSRKLPLEIRCQCGFTGGNSREKPAITVPIDGAP